MDFQEENIYDLSSDIEYVKDSLFKLITENENDIVSVFNTENVCIYVSNAVENKLGYTKEEFLTEYVHRIIHPDDKNIKQLSFEKLFQDRFSDNVLRYRHKKGHYLYLETKCSYQPAKQLIICIGRDITKQEKYKKELKKKESDLKEAQQLADIGSWRYDYINDEIVWSDHLYDIFELDRDTKLSNNLIYSMMHPDDIEKTKDLLSNYENEEDFFDIEYRIITPRNNVKHIRSIGKLVVDDVENIKYASGTIQNITNEKQIENQLKLSEKKYRTIFENIQSVYVEIDLDGIVQEVSPSVKEILGWKKSELIDKHISKFLRKENKFDSIIKKLLTKGKITNETGYLLNKSGEYECFSLNGKFLKGKMYHSPKFIFTGVVISELIQKENELKRYHEELIQSNKVKDRLFSIISHDLRGPLSGFVELTKMLVDEYESITISESKQMVTALAHSSAHIYELLENLLGWSRIQQGLFNVKQEKFDLVLLIKKIINLYQINAKKKNITINFEQDEELQILNDKLIISTIIRNFVSNAIKYTYNNGKVEIKCKHKLSDFCIAVKDNGIGIEKDKIDRILDINQEVTEPGTSNEKGSGLGMRFCSDLVKLIDGKIEIKSEKGKGSTFKVIIPE